MKATFKYIVTAFAVCAALVSCQKDNLTGNVDNNPAVGNTRVIEAHFGTATKSTLGGNNGRTPIFSNGDKIMVSNGTSKEECTVNVENGKATFTTSLTGDLTAIYPSAAAKLNGNAIDGVIVPATQDGTFAKANIAKATIASNATSATFDNQTTLLRFYVDKSIGVKSITITAGGNANIADGSKTIVVDPEGDVTLDTVTDDPGRRICYVSVLPGTFTSLKFTSVTTTQKDYTNNTVERTASNVTLATNKIYNAFIPYYIDLGTEGKWGYCNIGAFLPEDAGMYFAWGETTGHKPSTEGEGAFTFGKDNGGFAADFSNCSHSIGLNPDDNGPIFIKYMLPGLEKPHWGGTGNPDNLTVLEAVDDAATANWGEGWRMPKIEEFEALIDLCTNNFESGYSFGTSPNIIFLPAAGDGANTDLEDKGSWGIYWSSSLNIDNNEGVDCGPGNGNTLEFWFDPDPNWSEYIFTPDISLEARYLGCSIRPLKIVTADVRPDYTETGPEETVF